MTEPDFETHPDIPSFELSEVDIPELQGRMAAGEMSSAEITQNYLDRIAQIDHAGPMLRSVIETNPDALDIAAALDRERAAGQLRGPMHGIPILIKDNIATADRMETTAGSLALVGARPAQDAFVTRRLREAGAVILGKANLSEWANFRSHQSSSGWSARGGQCRNPYALDRSPSGSSSGSAAAAAASLCAGAVGTETSGSIVSPASKCGLVGLKPTVGLVSRSGIIPIAEAFDTAGPMCRSVRDVAILLGGLTGEDPEDARSRGSDAHSAQDYRRFLDPSGLEGARIGIARELFGRWAQMDDLMEESIREMAKLGATMVDEVPLPNRESTGKLSFEVMLYEFKDLIARYLASLGETSELRSLADLITFNEEHAELEMPYFGQDVFIDSEARGGLTDPDYLATRTKLWRNTREEGLDAVIAEHSLDAIVAPMGGPASKIDLIHGDHGRGVWAGGLSAASGYPHLTMPLGLIHELPVSISFLGPAWSEPTLLRLAYAFEKAMAPRSAPRFMKNVAP